MAILSDLKARLKEIDETTIPTNLSRAEETILLIKLRSERTSLEQEIVREEYREKVKVMNDAEQK